MFKDLFESTLTSHHNLCQHKGRNEVWKMYKEIMLEDVLYSISDLEKYYKLYPSSIEDWVDSYSLNPRKTGKDIVADSPKAREMIKSREYDNRYFLKILPRSQYFAKSQFYDYLISKNKIVIVKEENNEVFATTITNAKLVKFSTDFFESIWDLLPEPI